MIDNFEILPSIMCINWLHAKGDLDLISKKLVYFHWDCRWLFCWDLQLAQAQIL